MLFTIPQAIDSGAERFPHREAIRFRGQALTYGELAACSDNLAWTLLERGVRRHDRVGVLMQKSLETPIALYGIMKAGAAYVPLDPLAPPRRLASTLQHCGIRHIVSHDAQTETLRNLIAEGADLASAAGVEDVHGLTSPAVTWKEVRETPRRGPAGVDTIDEDLAYIIYTSGSTGSPKGIMHTHRSGLSFALWAAEAYSLHGEDRLSNQAPLYFDMSIFDFFAAAVAGATTVIIPDDHMRLPASYSQLLMDERISVFFTVPFALTQLVSRGALEKRDLRGLRWIVFGGEPMPTKHLRALMNQLPRTRFSNMYGPAETNGCTYWHVPSLDHVGDTIPIGRACPNMETKAVDDDGKTVSPGEIGELLVRGRTLMVGYWARPDLNERAFERRSMPGGHEQVYYRTGDLVEVLEDGNYRFVGRKDRQIKSRGYRIELDELQATIVEHPQVEEAAVYAIADDAHGTRIEAAVQLNPGATLEASVLVQYLRERLPSYTVPARIYFVDAFPRTSSRKIDYLVLRKRAEERESRDRAGDTQCRKNDSPPRSETSPR